MQRSAVGSTRHGPERCHGIRQVPSRYLNVHAPAAHVVATPVRELHACASTSGRAPCPEQRSTRNRTIVRSTAGSDGVPPEKEVQYKALVSELGGLSGEQLRQAAIARSDELLDSRFLFWLRDRERRPGVPAAEREAVARLGQDLTGYREWTDYQATRTLLPSLASSLAYSNLQQWRQETGQAPPQVAKGLDVETLYKLSEKEEQRLREVTQPGSAQRREASRSNIEEFAKYNKAYGDLASSAMARVRARLMGFEDDGPQAARAVLQALLAHMFGREERATYLPDAFSPPGLDVTPPPPPQQPMQQQQQQRQQAQAQRLGQGGSSSKGGASGSSRGGSNSSSSSSSSSSVPDAKPSFVVTSPEALISAIKARLSEIESSPSPSSAEGGGSGGSAPVLLPSGEPEIAVLQELLEDVEEYDRVIYSRKTPLERLGHNSGPWGR